MSSILKCAAAAVVLCGCDQPAIQSLTVSALEDQPKVISADIRVTSNMQTPHVTIESVAPTVGTVPDINMRIKSTSGAVPVFDGIAPMHPEYAPLAYGTKWKATVVVPYRILWHTTSVTQSEDFVVGAAKRCSSFDGELQRQGWGDVAELRLVPARRPPLTKSTPVNWMAAENARASAVTGALGITIDNLPSPMGAEFWIASIPTGSAYAILRHGSGIQLAVKTSRAIQLQIGVLTNRGFRNGVPGGEEVFEWVYSHDKEVAAGDWRVIELPFPALPAPISSSSIVTITNIKLNVANVRNGMQLAIDDVCPMT
jgi:hypothetical protein